MNKTIPKIFNGSSQLVISETFCCNPNHGIKIYLPITPEKTATLQFEFKSDSDTSKRGVETSQEKNMLTITLINFLHPVGSTLTKPLELNIGNDRFSLQIYGSSAGQELLCLTISLFKEGSKNA